MTVIGRTASLSAMLNTLAAAAALLIAAAPVLAADWRPIEADYVVKDFAFGSGETLPELKLHYRLLGTPHRDARGRIDNAVVVLHGTGGTGAQFLQPQFADRLFGAGQPLDLAKFYVILPDGIGHGGSSKPSDGLHAKFPHYTYADMVKAQHAVLSDALGLGRVRLIMGTSMGCMHAFVWGEDYPGYADALMPMACLPVEIAGRNRMWRELAMDAIRADPAWAGGEYKTQPLAGLRTTVSLAMVAGSVPLRQQVDQPTRAASDAATAAALKAGLSRVDANDQLYALDASRDYNPAALLGRITVPVAWINSADDFINPPGLGIAETMVKRMPRATFRLIPESAEGRGHSTHTWAKFWEGDLRDLLKRSE